MIEERFSMAGRRAVVTGGGGGFGRAFSRILAEAGAEVIPVDIDPGAAEETAAVVREAGGRAWAIECDVADATAVEDMTERLAAAGSGVDVLINNAGNSPPSRRVADIPVQEWDDVIAVNLRSAFLCTRALIPMMLEDAESVHHQHRLGARDEGLPPRTSSPRPDTPPPRRA